MKDIREVIYESYHSNFNKNKLIGRMGLLHLALWYDEKYRPLLRASRRDAPILELGCGSGQMLWYLRRLGFNNATGVDISKDQIELAQAKGFNAIHADAIAFLKEHKDDYEVIIAIDMIEHFKKDELFELLQLIHDALKPGGILILQTPNGDGLMPNYVIYGDLTHFTILSPLSLTHLLTLTGYVDIKIKELGLGFFIHFPLFIGWQVIRLIAIIIKFFEIGRIQKYWTESIISVCQKPNGLNSRISF